MPEYMLNDTRHALKDYLRKDKWALGKSSAKWPNIFRDDIWIYEILLRYREYFSNISKRHPHNIYYKLMKALFTLMHYRKGVNLGFSIPINVFGPGLSIQHIGSIVVNANVKVGSFCRIHEGTTIGATNGTKDCKKIGDYCFIATGAKIIGGGKIGNRVAIGANAVVLGDVEDNVTVAGIPAKIVSRKGSYSNIEEYLND